MQSNRLKQCVSYYVTNKTHAFHLFAFQMIKGQGGKEKRIAVTLIRSNYIQRAEINTHQQRPAGVRRCQRDCLLCSCCKAQLLSLTCPSACSGWYGAGMLYTETRLEGKAGVMMPWETPSEKRNNKNPRWTSFLKHKPVIAYCSPARTPGFSHFTFAILLKAGASRSAIKEGGEEKLPSL